MSLPSSPTLILDVRARRAERCVAALLLATSLLAPFLIDFLPLAVAATSAAGAATIIGWGLHHAGWIAGGHRISRLAWRGDGGWLLTDTRGGSAEYVLSADTRIGTRNIWLCWQALGRKSAKTRSMLLAAGDVPEQELRRLRIRLRLAGAAGEGAAEASAA